MGMNIVVVSPHLRKTGNTTIASLIALELSSRGKKVCIAHSADKSESLYAYFKLDKREDKTVNIDRLLKLIKSEVIKPEEFGDYCKSVNKNLDIFSVYNGVSLGNTILSEGEEGKEIDSESSLREFIATRSTYDYVVYDINTNIEEDNARFFIDRADVVVNVFDQNVVNLQRYRKDIKKINKIVKDKPQLVVLNKYDSIVGDVKSCASLMGLRKANNWHCVRYNGWIGYATNNGKLRKLYDSMTDSDIKVLDIKNDLKSVVNAIQRVKVVMRKQSMHNK